MTTPAAKKNSIKMEETPVVSRIPVELSDTILADFCTKYLEGFDKVSSYNKEVLAEKDTNASPIKVLEHARKLASPENADDQDKEVKDALDILDKAEAARLLARKAVLELTAKKMGITLSVSTVRDPEAEAPLRELRKTAVDIGNQLTKIASMGLMDSKVVGAVTDFLAAYPMPAVGRDQTYTFGSTNEGGKATPKYRVKVEVFKDGHNILTEDGFTKTAISLTKPVFGYERGKALKADALRAAWEASGNTGENTVKPVVEFDDNGLHFVLTKK